MQKVWILGDSYAQACDGDETTWPSMLSKKYNVSNHALGGTGPDYMLKTLYLLLYKHDIEHIKNSVMIIYMSKMSRLNFKFLKNPSESVKIPQTKRHKQHSFLLTFFFKYYYFFNEQSIYMSHLGNYALLKEMSKLFKKILVIPAFRKPTLLNDQFTINNDEKFTIGKGMPIFYHDQKGIDHNKVNHMREENHNIVYNMTVDWIEKDIPFDTGKLIKIS